MRHLFLLLALALALAGCSTERHYQRYQRQHPDAVAQTQARMSGAALLPDALPPEPLHPAFRKLADYKTGGRPGLIARALGLAPHTSSLHKEPAPYTSTPPRKCKGCTFNVVAGDQTNSAAGKKATTALGAGATASVIEKRAGPAVVASDSATLNSLAGAGNLATTRGNGNATTQTKQDTTREAPGVGATIAQALTGPLGWVVALGAVGGLGYVILLWRRRRAATT